MESVQFTFISPVPSTVPLEAPHIGAQSVSGLAMSSCRAPAQRRLLEEESKCSRNQAPGMSMGKSWT